ncbi:MAG: hypothetical protein C0624_08290 [Desulfuromonas sp.]|nr:MAG: hypothetical protein C0624_08290 [Desulfuromonas sp.]
MIIRMSKVEILGPKQIAEQVLESLRHCGTLHLLDTRDLPHDHPTTCLADNPEVLTRQLFYQDALEEINAILRQIPENACRITYLDHSAFLPSLLTLSKKHQSALAELQHQTQLHTGTMQRTQQHIELLSVLQPLLKDRVVNHRLSMVAIKLASSDTLHKFREELTRLFDGEYELISSPLPDQSQAIAILLPHSHLRRLQDLLKNKQIPKQFSPTEQNFESLKDYVDYLKDLYSDSENKLRLNENQILQFQKRWGPYYASCKEWLLERLAIHSAHSGIQETTMCFVINGWVPTGNIEQMRTQLEEKYAGAVTLNELKIHQQEMDDVPIILDNPAYFKPFEIFTRLLPLPRYTSIDPTPFLGLFFPIFFGMILGDAGYALVLLFAGIACLLYLKRHPLIQDASRVMIVCAGYTALFGLLYGEFFGEQGAHLIGLQPLIMSRSGTLMPMLYFTLAVGTFHILVGLTLGAFKSLILRHLKEGVFRFISLLFVAAMIILALTFFYPETANLRSPLLIAIGISIPVLIVSGGFLAPLEMLKHIGHIISYTRIMAVGMTSVMLAYVANRLAGEIGSLAAGIAVAFLLHLFNLILGIFAPTVHALRLHYVEFFSKFYESGGRQYAPFKRSPSQAKEET